MFVCENARGPCEGVCFKSGINHMQYEARQSPPFMIIAEAKKNKQTNKQTKQKKTKYEFKMSPRDSDTNDKL